MTDEDESAERGDAAVGSPEAVAAECETVNVEVGEKVEHVATVTLSRPDARNALDAQLRAELKDVLDAIERSSMSNRTQSDDAIEASDAAFSVDRERVRSVLTEIRDDEAEGVEEVTAVMEARE